MAWCLAGIPVIHPPVARGVCSEQNFCVPTETALTQHFCTEICILQAAGDALELFWEKGSFPNTEGKLEGFMVGQALISSFSCCV